MKCGHWHVGPVTWTRQRVCENCKQALTIQELAEYARMDMRYLEMKTAVLVSTVNRSVAAIGPRGWDTILECTKGPTGPMPI